MPIDHRIALQGRVADPLNALAAGFQASQAQRQNALNNQLLQEKVDQAPMRQKQAQAELDTAEMKKQSAFDELAKGSFQADYYGATQLAPYLDTGDTNSVMGILEERRALKTKLGYPTTSEDNFLQQLQSDPEGAKGIIKQVIEHGQKLFGARQPGRSVALSPGGQLYGSNGELLAENNNTRPAAQQSDYYTIESTPDGLMQVNARMPNDVRPLFGPDGKPLVRSQYDPMLQERINEGRAKGTGTGKAEASHANQLKEWGAFQQAFAATYPDIGAIFDAAPGSSMSQAVNAYGSRIIGGTNQYEAQADIQQLGAILLQQVPFPPGGQTELEMKQREATMGLISDPNISPAKKMQMISRFMQINEQKFKALNAGREEVPNGPVPPPPFGQAAIPQNMAPEPAIRYLMNNPSSEIKMQFRQKYGYLPEGM